MYEPRINLRGAIKNAVFRAAHQIFKEMSDPSLKETLTETRMVEIFHFWFNDILARILMAQMDPVIERPREPLRGRPAHAGTGIILHAMAYLDQKYPSPEAEAIALLKDRMTDDPRPE